VLTAGQAVLLQPPQLVLVLRLLGVELTLPHRPMQLRPETKDVSTVHQQHVTTVKLAARVLVTLVWCQQS
jgi:hypothetical protein